MDDAVAPASFRFFPVEPPLDHYVKYMFASVVSTPFTAQVEAVRIPELEAQLVFAIEAGRSFPAARPFGSGLHASLFLQPAHLQVIPISGTIREAVGVALRPDGLRLLLPKGAGDFERSPLIALEDLLEDDARVLLDRLMGAPSAWARMALLHAFLCDRAKGATHSHNSASRALRLLEVTHGDVSIEALAKSCGATSRTLRSALLAETGLQPKQLARVARIRHALHLLRQGNTAVAQPVGAAFSDQSHMCREFRALLGAGPGSLSCQIQEAVNALPPYSSDRDLLDTGLLMLSNRREV